MAENIILALFIAAAALPTRLLLVLFKRERECFGKPRWSQLFAGNALVLTALAGFGLALGEIYFRFIYDSTDALDSTKVSERWFTRHYHQNAAGCRDDQEYIAPGKRRVTFLGDSLAAGHGVKNVKDRFENRFRQKHPDCEVHVFARPGFDTGNELKSIAESVKGGYQLDVVCLVYCLNDLSDIVPKCAQLVEQVYAESDRAGWFLRHSYLLNTLNYRIRTSREPRMREYFQSLRDAYDGPEWNEQQQRLIEMKELVESHGGRLAVITFPFFNGLERDYQFASIHEQLDKFWARLSIPQLDLLPLYSGRTSESLTVNRFDSHPNEHAHDLATPGIDGFLSEIIRTNSARANGI